MNQCIIYTQPKTGIHVPTLSIFCKPIKKFNSSIKCFKFDIIYNWSRNNWNSLIYLPISKDES